MGLGIGRCSYSGIQKQRYGIVITGLGMFVIGDPERPPVFPGGCKSIWHKSNEG